MRALRVCMHILAHSAAEVMRARRAACPMPGRAECHAPTVANSARCVARRVTIPLYVYYSGRTTFRIQICAAPRHLDPLALLAWGKVAPAGLSACLI